MANRRPAEGEHALLPEVLRGRSLTVGIDLDEVLANLVESVLEHYHERTGRRFRREDMESYNFWDLWGGTREQAIEVVHDFFSSDRFADVRPVQGAVEAIEVLSRQHGLVIVTARPKSIEDETRRWVAGHFGESFQGVHLANHFSKEGEELKKSSICRQLEVDLMIEDSLEHAEDCAERGIPVVLLESPWNSNQPAPAGIIRAGSWSEISHLLTGRSS